MSVYVEKYYIPSFVIFNLKCECLLKFFKDVTMNFNRKKKKKENDKSARFN